MDVSEKLKNVKTRKTRTEMQVEKNRMAEGSRHDAWGRNAAHGYELSFEKVSYEK